MARAIIALALLLATVAAYWGVWNNAFIRIDDPYYVTDEPLVTAGLTREGFIWAFTTSNANNYHPLTWLAHMLDCQLFGVSAAAHHSVNLVLHSVNSIVLLLLFHRMTGALWRSAFIAAVFALHPLHVESVAWVAERKDVLSTFFALLTILAYAWYARDATPARYVIVFVLLALGLLAKPMLVTLPFVLILLDVWPLGRSTLWRPTAASGDADAMTPVELFLEKLPLLLLSVIFCGTTVWAQRAGGAVAPLEHTPMLARVLNPLMAYGRYLWKTFWPEKLAFYYPFTGQFFLTHLAVCAVILVIGAVFSIRLLRSRPWFAVGWFWFVGTLIPVIGIVQVGGQSIADRYMYIPMIGLTIIIAWWAAEYVQKLPKFRPVVAAVAVIALVAMSVRTQIQVRHWKDSVTLGLHTLSVTTNNWFAHVVAGSGYAEQNDLDTAIMHFEKAEQLMPGKNAHILRDLRVERERRQRDTPALP